MRSLVALLSLLILAASSPAEILFTENFDDDNVAARGWYDRAGWGKGLAIAGTPEVKPRTGAGCLRIKYQPGGTGGWMHVNLKKQVPEIYIRYYRMFPPGWEWPKTYGPHDTIIFAGSFGSPTDTDLSVYLDFWRTCETFVRVATTRQKWGYGGYANILRQKGGVPNRLPYNVAKPDLVQLGKWHCVEYYAKLSAPGKEDGVLRLWVNGKLVSELANLPLVDENHAGILFNHFLIGPYYHDGSPKEQWNYFDSLVISTDPIGTLEQPAGKSSRTGGEGAGKIAPPPGWGDKEKSSD